MLTLKQIRRIKYLKSKGMSMRNVARDLEIHRSTVKRYWDLDDPINVSVLLPRRASVLDEYADVIHELFLKYRKSSVVYEILQSEYGVQVSLRRLQMYVKPLRDRLRARQATMDREAELDDLKEFTRSPKRRTRRSLVSVFPPLVPDPPTRK